MYAALLSEIRAELNFLLFGQVGLDDLELLTLDSLSNSIDHRTTRQQKQSRGAWRDLGTHRVDEVLVNAIVSKVSGKCAHRCANCQAEEQQAEQHPPERTSKCARTSHIVKLFGLGFLGSGRPGDTAPSSIWINCCFCRLSSVESIVSAPWAVGNLSTVYVAKGTYSFRVVFVNFYQVQKGWPS